MKFTGGMHIGCRLVFDIINYNAGVQTNLFGNQPATRAGDLRNSQAHTKISLIFNYYTSV